jgi:hypothetical protein
MSDAPPRSSIGHRFDHAFASPEIAFVIPGPLTTRQARAPGHVADGLRRVRRRLLVPHADVLDADALRLERDRHDRHADDAEHVLDALLLEAARD